MLISVAVWPGLARLVLIYAITFSLQDGGAAAVVVPEGDPWVITARIIMRMAIMPIIAAIVQVPNTDAFFVCPDGPVLSFFISSLWFVAVIWIKIIFSPINRHGWRKRAFRVPIRVMARESPWLEGFTLFPAPAR